MITRRDFLGQALGALLASRAQPSTELVETVPFVGEGDLPVDTLVGSGLRGRRALDLSKLTSESLVTPQEKFFVRTRCPNALPPIESFKISVRGLLDAPREIPLAELLPQARPMGTHLVECAGNSLAGHFGLMSAASWTGMPLSVLLERVSFSGRATRLLLSGFDEHRGRDPDSLPGASWIFTFDELQKAGAFLATEMNGAPLAPDHGFPVRLIVPGWYGCVSIKWLNEVVAVDDSALATDQMREFASRTEQDPYGPLDYLMTKPQSQASYGPRYARDFKPATIDVAAAPVRVERHRVDGKPLLRVVGLVWGGDRPPRRLLIRFNPELGFAPVEDCNPKTNATWNLWSHRWTPPGPGRYRIDLKVDEPWARTRRLDRGFYSRQIELL